MLRSDAQEGFEFERIVAALVALSDPPGRPSAGLVDFELDISGSRVGIEVKTATRVPASLLRRRSELAARFDRILLVTPGRPRESDASIFRAALAEVGLEADWLTVQDLSAELGLESRGDLTSTHTQSALAGAVIAARADVAIEDSLSPSVLSLARQLPPPMLRAAARAPSLHKFLAVGERLRDRTFLMSDLVNFSTIVQRAAPDDLVDAMARYYRGARDLVWRAGGTVDKFMGDGMLAVFDYPEQAEQATLRAVQCAGALIVFGRDVIDELLENISQAITSGTRVGMANGDVWPADSGGDVTEVQLLSDAINLAARLQSQAPVDGICMERRTHTRLEREDPVLHAALNLRQGQVLPDQAKGQAGPVDVWIADAPAVLTVFRR